VINNDLIIVFIYYIILKEKNMTLNFQNKIVFPAPESSYTSETAFGQVIYIPRNYIQTKTKSSTNTTQKDGVASKVGQTEHFKQPNIQPFASSNNHKANDMDMNEMQREISEDELKANGSF
jgi:hypothetical protein